MTDETPNLIISLGYKLCHVFMLPANLSSNCKFCRLPEDKEENGVKYLAENNKS